ncbi:hypothetical protein [Planomicrobium sp. YIM 101495]|nr:hypothetical protein [Planomicrobium sp. YIM 101495]MTD30633.1 hypothetical protein [Planomicrobium sp. YIM 101495]
MFLGEASAADQAASSNLLRFVFNPLLGSLNRLDPLERLNRMDAGSMK